MSITLFNLGRGCSARAASLGGLFISSSFALALGACSGSDGSDDPIADDAADEGPSSTVVPSRPSDGDGEGEGEASTPSGTDEDGPDVTDIDESTAPGGQGSADGPGDSDEEAGGMSLAPAVPASELCAEVADWDPEWVQFEEEVLLLVNEFRSQPADCGVEGQFEAAAPLSMNPILRCSARLHSLDMFERSYFEHDTPDGVDPFERMEQAGFVGSGGGENIARGQRSPAEVMDAWMDSDGHCANVMRAAFDTIGVGYHPGSDVRGDANDYWTQNFGAPAFMRGGNRR